MAVTTALAPPPFRHPYSPPPSPNQRTQTGTESLRSSHQPPSIPDLDPTEANSPFRPSYITAAITLHVSSHPLARLSTPTKWSAALTASYTEIFATYLCKVLDLWIIHNDTTCLAQCILNFLSLPTRALLPSTNISPVNANLNIHLPNDPTPRHPVVGDIHKARPRPTIPPPFLLSPARMEALPHRQSNNYSTMAKIVWQTRLSMDMEPDHATPILLPPSESST